MKTTCYEIIPKCDPSTFKECVGIPADVFVSAFNKAMTDATALPGSVLASNVVIELLERFASTMNFNKTGVCIRPGDDDPCWRIPSSLRYSLK